MALMYETITMEQGEVGILRVMIEVKEMSAGGEVFAIVQVESFMDLIEGTTSRVEMPLGAILKI